MGFTDIQLLKGQELLEGIQKSNNDISSNGSIRECRLYKDEAGNLYIYYLGDFLDFEKLGMKTERFYIKIDGEGKDETLNNKEIDENELQQMVATLKPLLSKYIIWFAPKDKRIKYRQFHTEAHSVEVAIGNLKQEAKFFQFVDILAVTDYYSLGSEPNDVKDANFKNNTFYERFPL